MLPIRLVLIGMAPFKSCWSFLSFINAFQELLSYCPEIRSLTP
uniref:Uncharacterized protein n=1 Tax=Tetranychus urticae TaxID=32264 RepID=T1JXI5_TETUR